ncbi:hypothetical protein P378_16780 [Desulforamulus profundi]|uniref:Uncharacterized protein n=1 Tax=Desulforamulus profundi TaxID=1383067 RepID=A0A2C6M8D0_9FIRM|nr:hypothetical protein P378_16780 [Desulforamulus profundi]
MALTHYLEQLSDSGLAIEQKAKVLSAVAYCYYKLWDYYSAVQYFVSAFEHGYRKGEIYQFLRWCTGHVDSTACLSGFTRYWKMKNILNLEA